MVWWGLLGLRLEWGSSSSRRPDSSRRADSSTALFDTRAIPNSPTKKHRDTPPPKPKTQSTHTCASSHSTASEGYSGIALIAARWLRRRSYALTTTSSRNSRRELQGSSLLTSRSCWTARWRSSSPERSPRLRLSVSRRSTVAQFERASSLSCGQWRKKRRCSCVTCWLMIRVGAVWRDGLG